MFYREKTFSYPVCKAPFHTNFEYMTHEEAESYFQWHISVLPARIDVLSNEVARSLKIPREEMNLSPESLIPLWRWFLSKLELEETPEEMLNWFMEHDPRPTIFKTELIKDMKTRYSLETELIFCDVGKYLGEVFVRNLPGITWTHYEEPKSDFFVNMPVLQGFSDTDYSPPFQMFFEPVHMAHVQAAKKWRAAQTENDLFNVYQLWRTKNYHGVEFGSPISNNCE